METLDLKGKSLYKWAHGGNFTQREKDYFKQKNWAVVGRETFKKQRGTLTEGDFIYICNGNKSLSHIAQIKSTKLKHVPKSEKKNIKDSKDYGYLEVEPKYQPKDTSANFNRNIGFMPRNRSATIFKVPNDNEHDELDYFNREIAKPKYEVNIINTKMENIKEGQTELSPSESESDTGHLNTILYGPPGTGKTYNSIDKAVEIADPDRFILDNHESNKNVFDELRKTGQIEFVTFHQNYSYEDFMVGIRPDAESSVLKFKPHKGIFYEIAERARDNYKDSLKSTEVLSYENWVKKQFDDFKDYIEDAIEKDGKFVIKNSVSVYEVEEQAFIYTGEKEDGVKWKAERMGMHYAPLILMFLKDVKGRREIKQVEGIPALEKQHATYCFALIQKFREFLKTTKKEFKKESSISIALKKFVLIIDEINRANISKVFGELITLLEDDKRLGRENELKITLPNGEKDFGVPPNFYIIGTMNTADKSIVLIDIALRRRFEFIGYYPSNDLLNKLLNEGKLTQEKVDLLNHINKQVYEKRNNSADYLIGHAYFMKNQPIETVLKNKVIPLLMEYFSGKTDIVESILKDSAYPVKYNKETYKWV